MFDDISTVLPPHSTDFERALEQASLWVIQNSAIVDVWNPDTCPSKFLPFLSWGLSGDIWNPNWADEDKRSYVRATIGVHRRKGTVGGVKAALKAAGHGDSIVLEKYGWDFYDGQRSRDGSIRRYPPDHWAEYRVILARPITIAQAAEVRSILEATAPARCRLKALDFSEAANLYNSRIERNGTSTRGIA
jgi:phage tail P2-like protein